MMSNKYKPKEININDFYLKHKNTPCIVVGSGHTMMNFDYKKFKGIVILVGSSIYRTRGKINPDYLVTANNHHPIPEVSSHLKIINKFKNLTWIISDTACYDSIWNKNENIYKKNFKINYSFFDDRHFNNQECKPKKKCCEFIGKKKDGKMIFDQLAQKFKIKHNLLNQGVSVSDFGIAYAVLFGCNPIFIQGIDLPQNKYTSIYGKYYGSSNNKIDKFEQEFNKSLRKKFFMYYLKNLNFYPYIQSFYEKIQARIFKKSIFYYDFLKTKKILLWIKKISLKNDIKIYVLSEKSTLIKENIFEYLSPDKLKKKYKKMFRN